jgi:hypothetical protein
MPFFDDRAIFDNQHQGIGNLYNAAMQLTERQRKYLRGLGHGLSPVVLVGTAGVTPGCPRRPSAHCMTTNSSR